MRIRLLPEFPATQFDWVERDTRLELYQRHYESRLPVVQLTSQTPRPRSATSGDIVFATPMKRDLTHLIPLTLLPPRIRRRTHTIHIGRVRYTDTLRVRQVTVGSRNARHGADAEIY